jgi:hypothetical protein
MNSGYIKFLLLLLSGLLSIVNINAQSLNYSRRKQLRDQANEELQNGNYNEAIYYFRKLADTDQDTLLVAAEAHSSIQSIYIFNLEDSLNALHSAKMQQYLLDESIRKYPDNFQSYQKKLEYYKFNPDVKAEELLIDSMKAKFNHLWQFHYAIACHYVNSDFVWPGMKEFDQCVAELKKVLELNPSEFNSMLHLYVAYEKNKTEKLKFLKMMFQVAPERFLKNDDENNQNFPLKLQQ